MLDWLKTPPAIVPETLTLAGVEVPLAVTRHHNARRMTLRYDARRRQVRLTLPPRAPLRQALVFLQEKQDWLAAQIERQPQPVAFAHGLQLPVLGETLTLHHIEATRGRTERKGNMLYIPCPASALPRRVEDWLRAQLREAILSDAQHMAAVLGVTYRRISLRDTSSRWGSCSAQGNLSFCWRLVFAPREIVSYLVAHEVAHLREMNHSPAFWAEVARIDPHYPRHRQWLNQHANSLHRYGV